MKLTHRHLFGTRGVAAALIVPLYLRWQYEYMAYTPSVNSNFQQGTPHKLHPPKLEDVTRRPERIMRLDESIGEALESSRPIPKDQNVHRTLRRFEANVRVIVVGWTYRCEGTSYPNGGPDDPGYLSERNRVWLHEVAIEPREQGAAPWTAQYALALAEDIHP